MMLSTLLKSVVGQPGICQNSKPVVGKEPAHRFLLGAWLAALIVLVCSYTATMTSNIVMPVYTKPPTKFQELAHSDNKLFAEGWTNNLELDLASLNTTTSRKIFAKVKDTNIINNEV